MRSGMTTLVVVAMSVMVVAIGGWFAINVSGGIGGAAGDWMEDFIGTAGDNTTDIGPDDEEDGTGSGEDGTGGDGTGSEDDGGGSSESLDVSVSEVCSERSEGRGACVYGVCLGSRADSDEMTITATVANEGDAPADIWVRLRPPSGISHHVFDRAEVGSGDTWSDSYSTGGGLNKADDWDDGYRVQVFTHAGDDWPASRSMTPSMIERDLELLDELTVQEGDIPQSGSGENCVEG